MKKFTLLIITTLLAACAGQQPDPKVKEESELKAEIITSKEVLVVNEADTQESGANKITVTGSRVKRAMSPSEVTTRHWKKQKPNVS